MSIKNKARDRDDNGRICRKYTSRHKWAAHYGKSPGWWVNLFMTRPQRVEERRLCKLLERGLVDGDEATFPLGNRKPHKYYW
tara:strand:+ start:1696 stop:1941 length:246 start_codon:yes stop_codon:yes gene_type:complete